MWTTAKSKKRKKSRKQSARVEETSEPEHKEPEPILNPVFSTEEVPSKLEPDPWKVVESSKKRKNPDPKMQEKEPAKKEKKRPQEVKKTPKEKDQQRAREALRKGDLCRVHDEFNDDWIEGEIIATAGNDLTINVGEQIYQRGRNSPKICPVWDPFLKRYLPVETTPKQKKKSTTPKNTNKQPKKKRKKTQSKKLVKEEDILNQIDAILRAHNMKLTCTDISNHLKEFLQGGSWKSKYKPKFGSLKKFLLKHPDRYEITDNNGQVTVIFLDPQPVVEEKKEEIKDPPKTKPKPKPTSSLSVFVMFIFWIGLVVSIFCSDNPQIVEVRTEFQSKLNEVLDFVKDRT